MDKLINIYKRTWEDKDIHFWYNAELDNYNASIIFNGKRARLRAGIIIIKDGDKILLGEEADEPGVFSLPGGSINEGETPIEAAIREAQEEVNITAKNVEYAGVDYCECHDEVKDWVKENVPENEWWYNYYTCLCIGEYDKEYKGKVDKVDQDKAMKKSAEFYKIEDVINEPSFKYAWKVALYNFGYISDAPLDESLLEKIIKVKNKYQVQSEKGRNMGTYDTKKEAEKRLKQIEYFKHLNETHESNASLTESSRSYLISKAKSADKYADGTESRWTRKNKCQVAATVKDYNKIDMNTFWKEDKLIFSIPVKGETSSYEVLISITDILPRIQQKIRQNKNLLEIKCIYDALINAINSGDVKISCNCPDYNFRLRAWNSEHGDEAGRKETRKADQTNPNDTKGPACKHILAVLNNVEWLKKIASVINNYSNYTKENMENLYAKYIFPKLYGMTYDKAVQLTLDDFDDKGELKDDLKSDESTINLANALGKNRGKFRKGSNRNPVTKKKEESLQESYRLDESINLDESFDDEPDLAKHYYDHCVKGKFDATILFTQYKNKEEYKRGAEDFLIKAKKGGIKILGQKGDKKPVVCYFKYKQEADHTYTYAQYFISPKDKKRKITTYMRYGQFEFATIQLFRYTTAGLPERENQLTDFNVIMTDKEISIIKAEERELLSDLDIAPDNKIYQKP